MPSRCESAEGRERGMETGKGPWVKVWNPIIESLRHSSADSPPPLSLGAEELRGPSHCPDGTWAQTGDRWD